MNTKDFERISKALSDPHRIKILQEVKNYDCLACSHLQEVINLAQPSISHHIKLLVDAGLLIPEKEGRNMKYSIDSEVFDAYIKQLSLFTK